MKISQLIKTATLIVPLGLLGCGADNQSDDDSDSDDGSTGVTSPGGGSSDSYLSGSITMAPVDQAEVKIYKLDDDGSRGELLTSVLSDSNGEYTATVSYSGAVEVVATGGSYEDEATGELVERGTDEEIRTFLSQIDDGHVGVNALTTIAAANANENASDGLDQAISAANDDVAEMFGLKGVDIVNTKPDDLTDSEEELNENSAESKLGLAMAGVSQLASDNGLLPEDLDELVQAISEDYSDGSFDGQKDGKDLSVALSVTPKQAMEGLSTALDNFTSGDRNSAGFSSNNVPSIPDLPTGS